jgi:hypothetical protein
MDGARIDWTDVEFRVRIVDCHELSVFNPEHAREPFLHHDLQTVSVKFRDSARARNELSSATGKFGVKSTPVVNAALQQPQPSSKWCFANARPDPDFRYRSNRSACASSANPITTCRDEGRQAAVRDILRRCAYRNAQ